jgi:hypothetical protein
VGQLSRRRVRESGCDSCGLRANRRALKHRAGDARLQETRDRVPTLGGNDGSCGARAKWDFPPSCAELTGGSAPSPVAALVEVAETATAKTGGIRHGARELLINVHTKTRNPF